MDREKLDKAIQDQLASRNIQIRNRNAISALFGAVSDPVGSLAKVFFGAPQEIEAEKQRLQQEAVLDLLCRIDDAISKFSQEVSIDGLVETTAGSAEEVIGLHIAEGARNVRLQPGTHIRTSAAVASRVTGLKIGAGK